jgi:OOP family OmpA-OmpF porin
MKIRGISLLFALALAAVSAALPAQAAPYELLVNFRLDSEVVNRDKYHADVAELAELMKQNERIHVIVYGHADNTGAEHHNLHLSQRRAQAVVDKLVDSHGIPRERLYAIGFGESEPVASNDTEEGRAQNRRATASIAPWGM